MQVSQSQDLDLKKNQFCMLCAVSYCIQGNYVIWYKLHWFQNLPIERFWCEVNVRVLYPIKKQLVMLEDMGSLFIDVDKPAISTVCQKLVRIGLRRCIDAWNSHHIRGWFAATIAMLYDFICLSVIPNWDWVQQMIFTLQLLHMRSTIKILMKCILCFSW